MGHDRNRVDPASQSDRTGLQQRSQHVKHNWRSCLAQVGCKIAAFERSRRDRSHLLSAFPKRTRLAAGAVVQRDFECEPGDLEHVADSSSRWWPHCIGDHRIDPSATGEHACAGGHTDKLRCSHHRLHALHHVLRRAGFAVCPQKARSIRGALTRDTMDTEASIQQTIELANVGCEIVRITAPTVKDARNLEQIVKGLREHGCNVPTVADIHFKPDAAMEAAKWVDKVRINPGNYADSKKFVIREYTDEQYAAELARIRERFSPLVNFCKRRGIAMRIGTNHGSLSDRILNRYGDTPLGMVESALEFARIARDADYHDFVFSMKASNPKVMIAAYRLLVTRLNELGADWNYPLHLGVTEAGEGEDARIKSAIGIGSLLADGIGDTIRVSLTEDSIHEIPVAKALICSVTAGVSPAPQPVSAAEPTAATEEKLSFDPF